MTFPTEPFGLYLILTAPRAGYRACAEAAVAEGVRVLQLRMKGAPAEDVRAVARDLRAITRGSSTLLIINDDVQLAAAVDADGVHLGQDDLPVPQARRRWAQPGKIFGLSTHNLTQLKTAETLHPDYIGIGPIFPTPAKGGRDPVIGPQGLAALLQSTVLPAVAIGGINAENLPQVLACGIGNYAVIRAVGDASDPRDAIRRLRDAEYRFFSTRRTAS